MVSLVGCIVQFGARVRQSGLCVGTRPVPPALGVRSPRVGHGPVEGGGLGGVHVLHTEEWRALTFLLFRITVRQAAARAQVSGRLVAAWRYVAIESGPAPTPTASLWLLHRGEVLLGAFVLFLVSQPVGAGGKAARAVSQVAAALLLPVGLVAPRLVQRHLVASQQRLVLLRRVGSVCGGGQRHGVAGVGRRDLEGRHLRGQ